MFGNKPPERTWQTGEIHHVPCPYPDCKRPNDFRDEEEFLFEQWTGIGATSESLTFDCDHCKRPMQVVRAVRTAVVSVRVPERPPHRGVSRIG